MNRSQNPSKTFQKLKKKLKTQSKNSRIRHLINPYLPKKWPKIKPALLALASSVSVSVSYLDTLARKVSVA